MRSAVIGLAAVLAAGASHAADDSLTARGNEPSWRLGVSAAGIDFEAPGLGLAFKAPVAARDVQDGRPRFIAEAGGERLEATVIEQPCADTMTGMPFPTGVEVCDSIVHGGPFPATSDGRSTSVGTMAIFRFCRPVTWQSFPDAALPAELQDANPLGIKRMES